MKSMWSIDYEDDEGKLYKGDGLAVSVSISSLKSFFRKMKGLWKSRKKKPTRE